MDDIGDKLGKASDAYHTARKRLVEGRGNLVGRTEKLKKLGAKTKKALDEKLLLEAADDEE
jgi:DNA recombination protein RmuC